MLTTEETRRVARNKMKKRKRKSSPRMRGPKESLRSSRQMRSVSSGRVYE
jgi:hypothetical protein